LAKDLPCFYSDGNNYRWDARCISLWIIAIGCIHRLAQASLGDHPSLLYSLRDVSVVTTVMIHMNGTGSLDSRWIAYELGTKSGSGVSCVL